MDEQSSEQDWMKWPTLSNIDKLGMSAFFAAKTAPPLPPVVLFQEHRLAVAVAWAARMDKVWSKDEIPDLIRLDAHTDLGEEPFDYKKRSNIDCLEDAILAANSLGACDGRWVEFPMKAGWVNSVINLFVNPAECRSYCMLTDIHGKGRNAWNHTCRGGGGIESQTCPPWAQEILTAVNENQARRPIWLDIDLDFTAPSTRERCPPRNTDDLGKMLSDPIDGVLDFNGHQIVQALLDHAALITVATEPDHCGGFAGVSAALKSLGELFPRSNRVFRWFQSSD